MWRIDGAANWYRATTAYTTRPSGREKQMGHCHPSPKALGGVLSYFFFPISKKLHGLLAGTRVVWFLLYSAHSIHSGWGGPTATDNRDRTRIVYYFLCLSPSFHPFRWSLTVLRSFWSNFALECFEFARPHLWEIYALNCTWVTLQSQSTDCIVEWVYCTVFVCLVYLGDWLCCR